MNEKLDLVKLLKDCHKGMPLDCTIFDGFVTFNGIVDDDLYPIEIKIDNDYEERLNKYGGYNSSPYCKCVIFPKGKTSWEGFQRPFKDGDVLYIDCNDDGDTCEDCQYIFILKEINDDGEIHCYCYIDEANTHNKFEICWLTTTKYTPRFATNEEKQMLFDAIKVRGYKWNEETKSLDNLLVPKFNPKTLQHFDRVLVSCNDEWFCDFFSHYDDSAIKFNCICTGGCPYDYCIPYNDDTKHLTGKSIEEAPEFYKYWE